MTEPVSLDQARKHLNFEDGFVADDDYVTGLTLAARVQVEIRTGRSFSDPANTMTADQAALATQAILLIVGTWYGNREGLATDARSAPAELPLSVSWILAALKKWDDGTC